MTPVRFITNSISLAKVSVRCVGTGFAAACRNLKFISLPGSSAKAV